MRAPDGFGEAPSGLPGGRKNHDLHVFFIAFSCFPCILRFGSCFWSLLRIVKLNYVSRDLPASHSYMFPRVKTRILKGASWLHTPAKRGQLFPSFSFTNVSSIKIANSEARR